MENMENRNTGDGADGTPKAPEQKAVLPDSEKRNVQNREWYLAFVCACKLVWDPKEMELAYLPEHPVTVEPIKTDILVVKKQMDKILPDEIGGFFRTYNIIQFKSSSDKFQANDFLKELIYAFAYKVYENNIDLNDMSLTVFCPPDITEVLDFAKENHLPVQANEAGNIYYIDLFLGLKMQIVIIGHLIDNKNPNGKVNIYAPLNVFGEELDQKKVIDLILFGSERVKENDQERSELFDAIIQILIDKREKEWVKILNSLKEEGLMSEEELMRELCPNALKSALMRDREANSKKTTLAAYVSAVKSMAAAVDLTLEAAAEKISLPEGITREELLEALHDESAT